MNTSLKLYYKIYLEAEDITQSRIQSTNSFVQNLFLNCENVYMKFAKIDNESDIDDFTLRLYIDEEFDEVECSNESDAKTFVMDFMEFLDKIAMAQSYLDMEGSFGITLCDETKEIKFRSERGEGFCDFVLQ